MIAYSCSIKNVLSCPVNERRPLSASMGSVSMAKGWEKRVKAGEKRELKSLQMVK